jgi:hypothetical protein
MGPGAVQIAQMVPEVHAQLPAMPDPPRMEGQQASFRLFDSVAGFLRNATATQPLLLVLDDLHWADTPSLLLLQFVARELESAWLLIVGTYRDDEVDRQHPLSSALAELSRSRRTRRLSLQGLSRSDIARYLTLSTGSEPETALIASNAGAGYPVPAFDAVPISRRPRCGARPHRGSGRCAAARSSCRPGRSGRRT